MSSVVGRDDGNGGKWDMQDFCRESCMSHFVHFRSPFSPTELSPGSPGSCLSSHTCPVSVWAFVTPPAGYPLTDSPAGSLVVGGDALGLLARQVGTDDHTALRRD